MNFDETKVNEVTKEEFQEIIIDNLVNYLPGMYHHMRLIKHVVDKVNTQKVGFMLEPKDGAEETDSKFTVCPVYYIDDAYSHYANHSIEHALLDIAYDYVNSMRDLPIPNMVMANFLENCFTEDFIKANVYCQLINEGVNKRMLENIPYRIFFEFAIIYKIILPETGKYTSSITISNDHLRKIGISEDVLYEYALENTKKMVEIRSIRDCLPKLTGIENVPADMKIPYVICNQTCQYGAASILIEEKLYELANSLDSDFYLIPSSIHEWMVFYDVDMPLEDIANMIKMVNMEQVDVDERLSNSVYVYHRKNRKVSIAFKVDDSILDN